MSAATQTILVVGSVALDSIATPAGERAECLGGSASYFSVSASFYTPVQVIAVVGEDFPEPYLDQLRSRGVDLSGLEQVAGRTFRWRGRYGGSFGDAETLETQLNVFEHFEPKIPASHAAAPILFLGNIDPELQLRVLDQVRHARVVAMDTMNFWITGKRQALEKVLARVDLLIINETEARLLSGERNIVKAAEHVRSMGPRVLVIKRGEYGALLVHPDGMFQTPAVPLREVVDPTGAGDTFAGGLLGFVARAGNADFATLKQGVLAGTVMASFTCEGFSLDRLMSLDLPTLARRGEDLRALITL